MTEKNRLAAIIFLFISNFVSAQQSAEQNLQTGRKLKKEGKCDEAVAYFVKAAEQKNDNAAAFYESGWCYNELKEFSKAVETLQKANNLLPNNPDVLYELGYAYYHLDSADVSMTLYQKALEIDSVHLHSLIGVGDLYRDKKSQVPEALRWYLKALAKDEKNVKANYWAGWCYNDLHDYAKAILYLQKVVDQDKSNYPALNELGFSFFSLRRYNDAINVLQVVESGDAKSETAVYYLGLCYVNTGKKQEAVKRYNSLVLMNSKLAAALLTEIQKM